VILALNRKISWWLATLVLSRDIILLTAAAVILVVVGYRPFPPSIYGKATTALQILLVFLVVLLAVTNWNWLQPAKDIIGYLAAAFTVFSGFHYCFTVARRLNEPQHP
jgi:cardiolipin synthase